MTETREAGSRPDRLAAILVGGTAAAVLDMAAAFIQAGLRGNPPERVLQTIASGFLGREAYQGGLASAALGAATHLAIATAMAAAYVLAAARLPTLTRRPVVWGLIYGVGLWVMMYGVVLPLRWGRSFFSTPEQMALQIAFHTLLVGLPIALIAARLARPAPANAG